MLHFLAQHSILADGISIHIGNNVWSFSLNFIIYLIIAAIVGFVAESIVGWRLPFGFIGAIIAALIGICTHCLTSQPDVGSQTGNYLRDRESAPSRSGHCAAPGREDRIVGPAFDVAAAAFEAQLG